MASSEEVLVVASRLKSYIKEKSGMNTSADTLNALSEIIRQAADEAMKKAEASGRKTVMARDF